MELDEMKQAWARMDLRQDGMEALLRQDFRERRLDKAHASLRGALAWQAIGIGCWLAFTVFVASFWVQHRHVTHLLAIGLLLHAYGIAGIWSSVTQLLLISRIHLFDAHVLVMQRRLARILILEIGLRVKGRQNPNVIHTPNNVYDVPAGSQPGVPNRAWWNHERHTAGRTRRVGADRWIERGK